jgi:pimeloyl-ACP methyl ester carboxylesterase
MGNTHDVAVSQEKLAPVADGMEICFQTFGDPSAEPLLLVMGLSGPMTWWDDDFCVQLAERGFFVIRYDNRDVGRSSRGTGRVSRADLVKAFVGRPVRSPYSISDMAADGIGVLDHLGIERAHLAGMSMGGMIVQTMAVEHPDRVRSMTSIMSTTGGRLVGWQHPTLLPGLLRRASAGRDAYIADSMRFWKLIASPGFDTPEEDMEKRAADTFDRGVSASGVLRQMMAVLTQPNRVPQLARVDVPVLVVHGRADRMVHLSGGRATAKACPTSELVLVKGMGHDLPRGVWPTVVDGIRRTADRAARSS